MILVQVEEDVIRSTIRGFSRYIILWILTQKPESGYRISKELKRLTGRSFNTGVVYPLLYRLEERDFINGKWLSRGKRRIKQYSITEKGTKLIKQMQKLFEMPIRDVLKDFLGEGEPSNGTDRSFAS